MEFLQQIWEGIVSESPYMLRVIVAALCGAVIGVERSLRQKEAGIRTHVVVAIGAALAMVLSKYAYFDVVGIEGLRLQADVSRIASQVVTGVGFLGAGVIFVRGATIKGLTTAAGIWTTAAIGMAIGSGMYGVGIFCTVVLLVIQTILHKYFHFDRHTTSDLEAVLADAPGAISRFREQLEKNGVQILGFEIQKSSPGEIHCLLSVQVKEEEILSRLERLMEENEDIKSLAI
jgi:putative Mg2+ transporter-C (MgtC) family protein